MQLTGKTKILPIIGDPVGAVVSPPRANSWFAEREIDAVMTPLEIPASVLHSFWNLLRFSGTFLGCSVTCPHKQAAFAAVDRRTARAGRLAAPNRIRRDAEGSLSGEATDGLALCTAIVEAGLTLSGRSARDRGGRWRRARDHGRTLRGGDRCRRARGDGCRRRRSVEPLVR